MSEQETPLTKKLTAHTAQRLQAESSSAFQVSETEADAMDGTTITPAPKDLFVEAATDQAALDDQGVMALVKDVEVSLEVRVGSSCLPIADLFSLKAGSLLKLSQSLDEPVGIYLKEQLVAKGSLVVVDEHFAVEITEVYQPS